ncbi:MAG: SapB/AmfS family lanthipeptide [Spirillospora sp.]
MALLDLQRMRPPQSAVAAQGGKSAASKRCSGLSLLVC